MTRPKRELAHHEVEGARLVDEEPGEQLPVTMKAMVAAVPSFGVRKMTR